MPAQLCGPLPLGLEKSCVVKPAGRCCWLEALASNPELGAGEMAQELNVLQRTHVQFPAPKSVAPAPLEV